MTEATSQPDLDAFGTQYAQAWSSQRPKAVAAMFAEDGWIAINDEEPARGREAVEGVARGFMTDFPDLDVRCDRLAFVEGELRWHWTMKGTNTGPRGTGKAILISGYESLVIGEDGLIVSAHGHFDQQDWGRQLGG